MKMTYISLSKFLILFAVSFGVVGCNASQKSQEINDLSSIIETNNEDSILLRPDVKRLNEVKFEINGHNLSLENSVEFVYYLSKSYLPQDGTMGILVWKNYRSDGVYNAQNAQYNLTSYTTTNIEEKDYCAYYFKSLAAKELSKYIYALPYIFDGENYVYGELDRYSILDYKEGMRGYLYTPLIDGGATLKDVLDSIISYGATAQRYFGYNLDRLLSDTFYKVSVFVGGGKLTDGFESGFYTSKEEITAYGKCPDSHYDFIRVLLRNGGVEYREVSVPDGANSVTFYVDGDTYVDFYYMLQSYNIFVDSYSIEDDQSLKLVAQNFLIYPTVYNTDYDLDEHRQFHLGYRFLKYIDADGNDFPPQGTFLGDQDLRVRAIFDYIHLILNFDGYEGLVFNKYQLDVKITDVLSNEFYIKDLPRIDSAEGAFIGSIKGWALSSDDTVIIDSSGQLTSAGKNYINNCYDINDITLNLKPIVQ